MKKFTLFLFAIIFLSLASTAQVVILEQGFDSTSSSHSDGTWSNVDQIQNGGNTWTSQGSGNDVIEGNKSCSGWSDCYDKTGGTYGITGGAPAFKGTGSNIGYSSSTNSSYFAIFDDYDASNGSYGGIYTPVFNLTGYYNATLTFYWNNANTPSSYIQMQYYNGSAWTGATNFAYGTGDLGWNEETLSLPSNATEVVFFIVSDYYYYAIGLDQIEIYATKCTTPSLSISSSNVKCNGGDNGSATVSVSGDSSPYTYSWTGGEGTNATASNLAVGNYIVTVTTPGGCSATSSVNITQPAVLTVSANTTGNVSCNGGNNGSISTTVAGGTLPYTYSWTGGGNSATKTGLSAASYTVTVTDNNGCTASALSIITQPSSALGISISSTTNASCNGSTGSITAALNTGISQVSKTFSYEAAVQHLTIPSGVTTATITVTGAQGGGGNVLGGYGSSFTGICTVTPGHILSVAVGGIGGTSVADDGNGGGGGSFIYDSNTVTLLAVAAGGGGAGYTGNDGGNGGTNISTNASTNGTDGNASSGTSGNGGGTGSTDIGEGGGGGTGWLSNGANGGGSPYYYSQTYGGDDKANHFIGGAAETQTGSDVNSGGYGGGGGGGYDAGGAGGGYNGGGGGNDATAGGGGGGGSYLNGTLSGSVTSANTGNGSVTIIYSTTGSAGGTSPYTYAWTPNGGTNLTATVTAGTYTITVTDNHGCTAIASAAITQSVAIRDSVTSITYPSCSGASGSASIGTKYGASPYTYTWSPDVSSTATASNLSEGSYTVTVNDKNGCSSTVTFSNQTTLSNQQLSLLSSPAFSTPDATYTDTYSSGLWTFSNFSSTEPLYINGYFYVDKNLTISNSIVILGPSAYIEVENGAQLTITNCHLYACSSMWNGIWLGVPNPSSPYNASTITVNNSLIEDATHAIYATLSTFTSTPGQITITGTDFNNDYVGVDIENYNATFPLSINSCMFSCNSSSWTGSAWSLSSTDYLKAPYSSQMGYMGVFINTVNAVNVGVPSVVTGSNNNFENLYYGVYAKASNVNIYNNDFTNIGYPVSNYGNYGTSGAGILAVDNAVTGHIVNIGDTNVNAYNNFNSCQNGILARDSVNVNIYICPNN